MTRIAALFVSSIVLIACGPQLKSSRVEVSGRQVEVVELGKGDATVVFEAGLGNDWTSWDEIAREVSPRARVFAYSRPGYGQSDPTSDPRTGTRIVEDLRDLLRARGDAPPYVLVGHSFGGTYMELFARLHPDEVKGLVLVDSRPGGFGAACEAAGISGCSLTPSMLKFMPKEQVAEVEGFAGVAEELAQAGHLGQLKVRVLTSGQHSGSATFEALWQSMHLALAQESTQGEQLMFPTSGHNLQVEQPHQVAQIILSVLGED